MKTMAKLFLIAHHVPVLIGTEEALLYYKTVARIHGFSLIHAGYGFVMV